MPSASWLNGWITSDVVTAAEYSKSMGAFFDSTAGGAVASFDITSVPTWGSHLRIEVHGRSDTALTSTTVNMRFNNDTGANYASEFLAGQTATASAGESTSATSALIGGVPAASATANHAGSISVTIPNFRGTTFFKNYNAPGGFAMALTTTNILAQIRGGVWASTSAITRVTIFPGAGNFAAGSRCTAYVLGP